MFFKCNLQCFDKCSPWSPSLWPSTGEQPSLIWHVSDHTDASYTRSILGFNTSPSAVRSASWLQQRLFAMSFHCKRLQIHTPYSFREGVFLGECFSNYFLLYKLLKVTEGPPGHRSSSPIFVREDKNAEQPIWAVICNAHKWWRYEGDAGLKKKANKEKRDEYWSPCLKWSCRKDCRERKEEEKKQQGFWEMPNLQQYRSHKKKWLICSVHLLSAKTSCQMTATYTHAQTHTEEDAT